MKKLVLAGAVLAASFVAPATSASAVGCLPGWYQQGIGIYNPLTGKEIEICQYRPDAVR